MPFVLVIFVVEFGLAAFFVVLCLDDISAQLRMLNQRNREKDNSDDHH